MSINVTIGVMYRYDLTYGQAGVQVGRILLFKAQIGLNSQMGEAEERINHSLEGQVTRFEESET